MGQQQQTVALRPDEIAALIKDGTLTPEIAASKLTGGERAIYNSMTQTMGPSTRDSRMFADLAERNGLNGADPKVSLQTASVLGPGDAAIMGPALLAKAIAPMAKTAATAAIDTAKAHPAMTAAAGAVASQASRKLGVPPDIANALSELLGFKALLGSGGATRAAAAEAAPTMERGAAAAATDVGRLSPAASELSSPDLIQELVTGSSHPPGTRTPMYWSDPALRSSVEKLKRQVQLRSPGGD